MFLHFNLGFVPAKDLRTTRKPLSHSKNSILSQLHMQSYEMESIQLSRRIF